MKRRAGLPRPEHVLEMLYHRQLGYSRGNNNKWSFKSAFKALDVEVSDEEVGQYRDYFIEHGFGKFDGRDDPGFTISPQGELAARRSIDRRKPWYSGRRLRSYDWAFIGGIAAIIAALLSFLALFKAS